MTPDTSSETNSAEETAEILHCETCGRDVEDQEFDEEAGECVRCRDTRNDSRDSTDDYVEQKQRDAAAEAWKGTAKRHAEAVNSGEKTPGGTSTQSNGGF